MELEEQELKHLTSIKKKGFMLGYKAGYHTHNQYIESALMGGVVAFVLLLMIIGNGDMERI